MQRSDVRRGDGTWVGLSLEVRNRPLPGLGVLSAGARLLLAQESRTVVLAVVAERPQGVG
ncbi:hypothetical protein ABH931_006866 [Streptacidiphilus sp. MAP12-33]|uniref:hypothetical protein n=1 Tax=Streptacidiphilus sp. MAP12-33 TaxID=3156266 RepID=UPI0035184A9F